MATATKNTSHSFIPPPPSTVLSMRNKSRSKKKSNGETVPSTASKSKGTFSLPNNSDEDWVCFTDGSNSQEMMILPGEFGADNKFSFQEEPFFQTETYTATASAPPFEATIDSRDDFQDVRNFDKIDIVADDIIEVKGLESYHKKKPVPKNPPRPPRPGNVDANKNRIGSSNSFNSSGSDSSDNRRKTGSKGTISSNSSRISNNLRGVSIDERSETLTSRSSRHSSKSSGEHSERSQRSSSRVAPTERRQSSSSRETTEERRSRSSSRGAGVERRQRSSSRGAGVERRTRSSSRGAGVERRTRSSSRGAGVERRQRSSSRGVGVERRTRSSSRGAGVERRQRSSSRGAGVERRHRSSSRGAGVERRARSQTRGNQSQIRSKSATRVGLGRDRSKSQAPGDLSVIGSSSLTSSSQQQDRSGARSKERGRSVPVQKRTRSNSRRRFFSPARSAVEVPTQRTDSDLSKSTSRSSSIGPGLFLRKKSSSIRSGTGSMSTPSKGPPIPNRHSSSVLSASASSILKENSINESSDPSEHPSERSEINSRDSGSGSLRVKLFGDQVSKSAKRAYLPYEKTSGSNSFSQKDPVSPSLNSSQGTVSLPKAVHTRQLLKSSVCHNTATGLWISTVNTNQKSSVIDTRQNSKYLKAFSFLTEREAKESSYANAPPIMLPFTEHRHCFICQGKFAIFRRASHCRNCGVCICNSCSVSWHKAMIPDTYNIKKESYVKVCKSCDFLSRSFRHSLLQGQYDNAVTIYNSGNINLRCPFMNVKGSETMFPIHCAAQGGNLVLVRWLIDVHYCPIKMLRTGNKNKGTTDELLATSKGRNILDFVMAGKHVDMLRYLVREKGVSVHEIKDLKTSLNALEAILSSANDDDFLSDSEVDDESSCDEEGDEGEEDEEDTEVTEARREKFQRQNNVNHAHVPNFKIDMYDDSREDAPNVESTEESDEESVATTVADACIICYENTIDCVITPCGHQICCLQCSDNLKTCPVCNIKCDFIRIYKP